MGRSQETIVKQLKQGPGSCSRIYITIALSSSTGTKAPSQVEDGNFRLSSIYIGLCLPPKPLHEYVWILSLKLLQFCCLGRHCFGKDPRYSPYLRQVINPSFFPALAWLCLLAWHPPRGKPTFQVTLGLGVISAEVGITHFNNFSRWLLSKGQFGKHSCGILLLEV